MNGTERPRYEFIALDIAQRIVNDEFVEGEKLYGRSNLAGLYNVSPETIRRAISLLQDMGAVTAEQGRGILIKSKEAAFRYIDRFNEKKTLESLRNELTQLLEARRRLDQRLESILIKTIEFANRLRNVNAFNPVEVPVKKQSRIIGKTLAELKFWENTGATIIAIRRGEDLILSPGPHREVKQGDFLVLVGDEYILSRTMNFLYGDTNSK